jgi:hypothetical protein
LFKENKMTRFAILAGNAMVGVTATEREASLASNVLGVMWPDTEFRICAHKDSMVLSEDAGDLLDAAHYYASEFTPRGLADWAGLEEALEVLTRIRAAVAPWAASGNLAF